MACTAYVRAPGSASVSCCCSSRRCDFRRVTVSFPPFLPSFGAQFRLKTGAQLHAQRPLATLLFLCSCVFLSESSGLLPRTPGAEWIPHMLAVKYLLSHVPRHEPYGL